MNFKSINMIMKKMLVILVLSLIPVFVYASNNSVSVTMGASASIVPTISISSTTLQFPTIYDNYTGKVFTTDTTVVPGGVNGSNSTVTGSGPASTNYTVSFGTMTFTSGGTPYTAYPTMASDGCSTSCSRTTDSSGNDQFDVKGSVNVDSVMIKGSFNGTATMTFIFN